MGIAILWPHSPHAHPRPEILKNALSVALILFSK